MNGFSTEMGYCGRLRNRVNKCCLMENKQRCNNTAENLLCNVKCQEMVINRNLILTINSKAGHIYVCDNHDLMIHNARGRRSRFRNRYIDVPKVDFSRLQLNTLRRYKRHLKLTGSGMNKAQLVQAVTKHFSTIQVNEKRIVNLFFNKIKPKQKNGYN